VIEEEDGVVGDDPQQQHDDQRLELLGQAQARGSQRERDDAKREQVRHAGGREGEQRCAHRAEVDAHDREDQQHREQLDGRQVLLDDAALLEPARHGPGDAHRSVEVGIEVLVDEALGKSFALAHIDLGSEEQQRECSVAALAVRIDQAEGVRDRQGAGHVAQGGILATRQVDRSQRRAGLCELGQPVGIALDDDGSADQWEPERLQVSDLCLHCHGVLGHQPPQAGAPGRHNLRQRQERDAARDEPDRDDRHAPTDDENPEAPGDAASTLLRMLGRHGRRPRRRSAPRSGGP
jgi:hypothetical protein